MYLIKSFFGIIISFVFLHNKYLNGFLYKNILIFFQKRGLHSNILSILNYLNTVKWVEFFHYMGNIENRYVYLSFLYETRWKHFYFSELYENIFIFKNDTWSGQNEYELYVLNLLLRSESRSSKAFPIQGSLGCLLNSLFLRYYEYLCFFSVNFGSILVLDFNKSLSEDREVYLNDLNTGSMYISDTLKGE